MGTVCLLKQEHSKRNDQLESRKTDGERIFKRISSLAVFPTDTTSPNGKIISSHTSQEIS
jgi:hypothetical protein